MRFHVASKDQKAYIIDSDEKKVHGPYYMNAVLTVYAAAFQSNKIANFCTVPVRETKLLGLDQMHQLVDGANENLSPKPFFSLDPLPGWVVRWVRSMKGLSQKELARELGSGSYRTVQDWERGERNCTGPARLAIIALAD